MALKNKLSNSLYHTNIAQDVGSPNDKNTEKRVKLNNEFNITSKYFTTSISEQFINIEIEFNRDLSSMVYDNSVSVIYNPVEYAFDVHKLFINRYLDSQKKILFLGMNPGPYGMAQTGVPFGSVPEVRDWLQICGDVPKPLNEISSRPILGFNCNRTEISGKRFWGLFQELCETPDQFFKFCFVHNLCPLLLLSNNGKNITPSELKGETKRKLLEICEKWLLRVMQLLGIEIIIGIGRFAQERAEKAIKSNRSLLNTPCRVEFLPHPSPRSVGNTNWNSTAIEYLTKLNIIQYFKEEQTSEACLSQK